MSSSGVDALVVACLEGGVGPQGMCPAGFTQVVQPAFLVAPGQGAALSAALQPFDAMLGAEYFAFAFGTVLGVYLLSLSIGAVIQVLKRA